LDLFHCGAAAGGLAAMNADDVRDQLSLFISGFEP
jgi:hypothetical protein